jgi:hypothetical protein
VAFMVTTYLVLGIAVFALLLLMTAVIDRV